MRISLDDETTLWMHSHQGAEVTIVRCEKCQRYHKVDIMHECQKICGTCKWWDVNDTCHIGCRCSNPYKRFNRGSSVWSSYKRRTEVGCSFYET